MSRKAWDQLVSGAALVIAVVLVLMGAAAIYGGDFGRDNVRDRLQPQNVVFPPYEAMTPEEQAAIGDYAGQQVVNGQQAEAFATYIQGHLAEVNEGATYSETSAAARAEGLDPDTAAELQGKADTLFKGETLRSILLNAYGWWTVATIAFWAGWFMVAAGIVLLILAIFGFRHAKKAEEQRAAETPMKTKDYASTNA
jgi:cbb3-type cytochrome oxidase subunit 3